MVSWLLQQQQDYLFVEKDEGSFVLVQIEFALEKTRPDNAKIFPAQQ